MSLDLFILGGFAIAVIWAARNDRTIQAFRRTK